VISGRQSQQPHATQDGRAAQPRPSAAAASSRVNSCSQPHPLSRRSTGHKPGGGRSCTQPGATRTGNLQPAPAHWISRRRTAPAALTTRAPPSQNAPDRAPDRGQPAVATGRRGQECELRAEAHVSQSANRCCWPSPRAAGQNHRGKRGETPDGAGGAAPHCSGASGDGSCGRAPGNGAAGASGAGRVERQPSGLRLARRPRGGAGKNSGPTAIGPERQAELRPHLKAWLASAWRRGMGPIRCRC